MVQCFIQKYNFFDMSTQEVLDFFAVMVELGVSDKE